MIQKTYKMPLNGDFSALLDKIEAEGDVKENWQSFFVVHEREYKEDRIKEHLRALSLRFPSVKIVGMTLLGKVAPWVNLEYTTFISLLSFETSKFFVFRYDCNIMMPDEAGRQFSKDIEKLDDLRAIYYISSGAGIDPEDFFENIELRYEHIPIFGSQAGIEEIPFDSSLVFLEDGVYKNTIIAVPICGKELSVLTGSSFGWRPLGREMTITGINNGAVNGVDDKKVLDIYYKYLNIEPGAYFYADACAFPFIMGAKGYRTSRVPNHLNEDGSVSFGTKMNKGDKISLSYAKNEYLFKESIELANKIIDFEPEAVYASVCINRRIFLGNESADVEIGYFKRAFKDISLASGLAEILRKDGKGGFMNSCIIVAAFREGNKTGRTQEKIENKYSKKEPDGQVPLSDRLVTFLEATTDELRSTISELTEQASHDLVTGIYNRTWTDKILKDEIAKTLKKEDHLALFMFDIDNFKTVNDDYGHAEGDIVLNKVAELVENMIGSDNVLGRWGGDEFLCIFRGYTIERAKAAADEIREAIKKLDLKPVKGVTISGGVAEIRLKIYDKRNDMLIRADKALYHSKNNGRDQVNVYSEKYDCELKI